MAKAATRVVGTVTGMTSRATCREKVVVMLDSRWESSLAQARARTETECAATEIDGYKVESVKRGVHNTDWMAWVNGDRGVWGAGRTRQEAIESAVRRARSLTGIHHRP